MMKLFKQENNNHLLEGEDCNVRLEQKDNDFKLKVNDEEGREYILYIGGPWYIEMEFPEEKPKSFPPTKGEKLYCEKVG